jgi:dTDP-4-amino-4,6-dideoxygalactose transaminase
VFRRPSSPVGGLVARVREIVRGPLIRRWARAASTGWSMPRLPWPSPVLVDVEQETYCIDPDAIEAAVTDRTRAVIVVHLYDGLANMDRVLEIAARHHLAVIEDCAHSQGSRWNDRGVGSLADLGTFSFQSSKSLTCGEVGGSGTWPSRHISG